MPMPIPHLSLSPIAHQSSVLSKFVSHCASASGLKKVSSSPTMNHFLEGNLLYSVACARAPRAWAACPLNHGLFCHALKSQGASPTGSFNPDSTPGGNGLSLNKQPVVPTYLRDKHITNMGTTEEWHLVKHLIFLHTSFR